LTLRTSWTETMATNNGKILLTTREAAALLGLHPDTLRELVARRAIPFRNLSAGKRRPTFRFIAKELEAWAAGLPGKGIEGGLE